MVKHQYYRQVGSFEVKKKWSKQIASTWLWLFYDAKQPHIHVGSRVAFNLHSRRVAFYIQTPNWPHSDTFLVYRRQIIAGL